MCHLKSLIFDCISFTEGLITSLFTADSEAPASTYCFIFIVLGQYTSTPVSMGGTHRGDKGSSGGRGLAVCCEQWRN
jgi:hypothetical protein